MKPTNLEIFIIFTFFFILTPIISQAITETYIGSNIISEINPKDPAPGSMVTITLNGFGFDTDQAIYEWSQDNFIKKSGVGEKKFTFQIGRLGKTTRIDVSVYRSGRRLFYKSFYFDPSDINILWEADSLVPLFYQGKARATAGSTLKLSAIPYITNQSGKIEPDDKLYYDWYINGVFAKEFSGKGKKTIPIPTKQDENQVKISLKVLNGTKDRGAKKELSIYLNKPEIIFYEQKPLEGVNYGRQITTNYDLYEEEMSFIAIPFFWPKIYVDNLSYLWKINGLTIDNKENKNTLTVRKPSGGLGINEINLQVNKMINDKYSINKSFNVKFGNNLLKSYNVE